MMPGVPRVGGPTNDHRPVCQCSDFPWTPICGANATRHVMSTDAHGNRVGLPSCEAHMPVARMAGEYITEHPYGPLCGLPGVVWDLEREACVLDTGNYCEVRS